MGERSLAMGQAEFARHRGVSKAVVTKWKGQGLLVMTADGKVDVEASEWNLDQRPATYRGGTAHRPVRTGPKEEPDPRERPRPAPSRPAAPPAEADGDAEPVEFDPENPNLPLNLAAQRKENYLGLLRKQEHSVKQGALVDRPAAELAFFEEGRALRDAWIAWPARVAIEMADELKIDPRLLTPILSAHVHKHLTELGEPEAGEFG